MQQVSLRGARKHAKSLATATKVPSAHRTGGHIKLAPFEKGKTNLSPMLFLPPNPMPAAHFGSKASFLRCDLQTLNYSRSYRKRRRERKEKKRKFRAKAERTKLSIDQWKYSHSGDRQPRREGEGEREGQARTVMYRVRQINASQEKEGN